MLTDFANLPLDKKLVCPGWTAKAVCVAALAFMASGCSIANNTLPELSTPDQIVTDSVVTKARPEGLADTDAEVIKEAVAGAEVSQNIEPLAWSNPQTGTSGTIVAVDRFMGKHGQDCRGFKTSVTNYTGVNLYNGETCKVDSDKWVLSWFKSADAG